MISEDAGWISFNYEIEVPQNASTEQVERLKAEALEEIKKRFEEESGLSLEQYGKVYPSLNMKGFHFAVTQAGAPPFWKRPQLGGTGPSEPA